MAFAFFGPGMSKKLEAQTIRFFSVGVDNPEAFSPATSQCEAPRRLAP